MKYDVGIMKNPTSAPTLPKLQKINDDDIKTYEIEVPVNIKYSGFDEALEKINQLAEKLEELKVLIDEMNSIKLEIKLT